jgi:hypothetical protein
MARPTVNPGTVVWSGEHWINYLRRPNERTDSGMVSLYHVRYSPIGEGTVAFVDIAGDDGLTAICADNRELAPYLIEKILRARGRGVHHFDRDLPVLDATFTRGGSVTAVPWWEIRSDRERIVATWLDLEPPFLAELPAPSGLDFADFYSVFFFASNATIERNGRRIDGRPYTEVLPSTHIGGERSSCMFALSETMVLCDVAPTTAARADR